MSYEQDGKIYTDKGEDDYPSYGPGYRLERDGDIWRRADGNRFYDGRYVVPIFDPGKPGNVDLSRPGRDQQRATTYTGITDYKGPELALWEDMYLLKGVVLKPELIARIAMLQIADKRKQSHEEKKALTKLWAEIQDEAFEASNKDEASANGSAIHEGVEHVNKGGSIDDLPEVAKLWRPHIEAYLALMAQIGVAIDPREVERTVVNVEAEVVGKFDFIGTIELTEELCRAAGLPEADAHGVPYADEPGKPRKRMFDAKSGNVEPAFGKRDSIGRQLLFYATADAMFNAHDVTYDPMPQIDDRVGFIVEIPWHQADGERPVARLIPVLFEKNGGAPGLRACEEVKGLKRGSAKALTAIGEAFAPETVREQQQAELPVQTKRSYAGRKPKQAPAEQQVVAEAESIVAASYADRIRAAKTADEVRALGKEAKQAGATDDWFEAGAAMLSQFKAQNGTSVRLDKSE